MNTEPCITLAIADDYKLIRMAMIPILESFGYKVIIEAQNGKELIDKLSFGKLPHICVLDINMPIMDGFQTTKYLKEKWPAIMIMIFSMNEDIRYQQKAIASGADAFLTKYASPELLKETLEKLAAKIR